MAVDVGSLQTKLQSLFSSPPSGGTATSVSAQSWADAMQQYAASVIPASATVATAAATLKSELEALFNGGSFTVADFEVPFGNFAAQVGSGMAGYTVKPPTVPIGFASIGNQPDAATAAQTWANTINTWFITGTATSESSGETKNWS